MNSPEAFGNDIRSGQSGHWAIIDRADAGAPGALPAREAVMKTLDGQAGERVLRFRAGGDGVLHGRSAGETCRVGDLGEFLLGQTTQAARDEQRTVRLVVTEFERLPFEDQLTVLSGTREKRETTSKCALQIVLCGAWNYRRVRRYWEDHRKAISFAPDYKRVFFHRALDANAVHEQLVDARLTGNSPSCWEAVCAELLVEQTGGDAFLVDYAISCLIRRKLHLKHLESALEETRTATEVREELLARADGLSPAALDFLEKVLRRQIIRLPEEDVEAEELRRRGLADVCSAPSRQIYLRVASPMVERVLRDCWTWPPISRPAVYQGADLARPHLAINTAAYRLVAQIETFLRNMIVLGLDTPDTQDWTGRLEGVKTLAHDGGDIANEFRALVRELIDSVRPFVATADLAIAEPAPDGPAPATVSPTPRKPAQASLLHNARDWRDRSDRQTVLSLDRPGIICFFTTEGLVSLLANEKQKIYPEVVRPYFPQKSELAAFLEHFVVIRAAVAHNQPITLHTLQRLETLRDDLETRLATAVLPLGQEQP